MRMRKKPNLLPRMERASAVLTRSPEALRGKWLASFPGFAHLHLELGCGKGGFTCAAAAAMPDTLLAAVEKVPDAMVVAMERAGEVERIYINFCDPWPKKKQFKRRLTAPGFLALYRQVLAPGGEIWFKTDNLPLFDWSCETMAEAGFQLREVTRDLHASGPVGIMTDYEKKFVGEGKPICRLVARL